MNKYKIMFWIAFTSLTIISTSYYIDIQFYKLELDFKNWEIHNLEYDIDILKDIQLSDAKTKNEIEFILKKHVISNNFEKKCDTILLHEISLIFKDDVLINILKNNSL